jgi:trehalose/maltose transport system permease protein
MVATATRRWAAVISKPSVTAWILVAPLLIALIIAAGWPLARSIWLSFTDASLAGIDAPSFVGLRNYLAYGDGIWYGVLADSDWWRAVLNTLLFALVSVSLEGMLGVAIAVVLNAQFPGRGLVRAAVLVPWAVPTIVSAKMWSWMLNDQFGIVNDILLRIGVIQSPLAWTADPTLSMITVVIVDVWKTTPFVALLVLAALQMIPQSVYEAARIDGASKPQQFIYMTLPLIRPALWVALVFRALDALRVFDLVYVLTPNSPDTMSMSSYARQQAIEFQDLGYGSAAATLLFVVIALTIVMITVAGRVRLTDQAISE